MSGRSLKVRPSPSVSALKESPGAGGCLTTWKGGGPSDTSVPEGVPEAPSPPGAWPSCPPGRRGPNPVHPGRPFCQDRYPGGRCASCKARPVRLSGRDLGTPGRLRGRVANLSTHCPSNHLQAQVTTETGRNAASPAVPASTPPAHPRPGRTNIPRTPPLVTQTRILVTPRPSTHRPAPVKRGGRTHCACADGARAPPYATALRRVSPRPLLSSVSPLLSPGGEPGRYGGRGRDVGPPPGWAGT